MLESVDPALCEQASPTRTWATMSSVLLFVLSRPLIAIALLLILASLFWLFTPRRWKKRVTLASVALVIGYLVLISPIFSAIGTRLITAFVPSDSGETADAIVVLGRGYEQNETRSNIVGELWENDRAPIIVPSGRKDALAMENILRASFPKAPVASEPCSLTTDQNAEFTAALLRPEGVESIILVTDPPHMWRSLLTFQSFGFKVIPHYTPLSADTIPIKKRFLFTREAIGLVNYAILGRYRSREVPTTSVIYDDNAAIEHTPVQ